MNFIGLGTLVNVCAVICGAVIGMVLGDRFSPRARAGLTDTLGILTLILGGLSLIPLQGQPLTSLLGSATLVVILIPLLIGVLVGSALGLEERLDDLGTFLRKVLIRKDSSARAQQRFVNGFVTASLVSCIGPLAFLGSLNDGLGLGADQLYVKSVLDFFTAIAFATSFGIGVGASALTMILIQGGITLFGWAVGDIMPRAAIDAASVVGGIILLGVGLRMLQIRQIRVADMLPALLFAPLTVWVISWLI